MSTSFSVIGNEGVKARDTFTQNEEENLEDISLVSEKSDEFCTTRTRVTFKHYPFNSNQEPSENISTYLTEL